MTRIFVNLKRFDVPRSRGGLAPADDPAEWIRLVLSETIRSGITARDDIEVVYFLPESLLLPAKNELDQFPLEQRGTLQLGSQGVYREDIRADGNFGAFTTLLPAAAAAAVGASWSIIGHSEERKDKLGIMAAYDRAANEDEQGGERALAAVDRLVNREAQRALEAGLNVLICMGESALQRGPGSFDEQKPRVQQALRGQVERGLANVKQHLDGGQIVVGYEPIWAIGPGKTPPAGDYIAFVADYIKTVARELYGRELPVVYGGGLKGSNAEEIGSVGAVDGGLVALTRFTEPIGFDPGDLTNIIESYLKGKEST